MIMKRQAFSLGLYSLCKKEKIPPVAINCIFEAGNYYRGWGNSFVKSIRNGTFVSKIQNGLGFVGV